MFSELRPRRVVDGHLQEIMGTCIDEAVKTFKERWGRDTNPRIVQMIHQGQRIDHWYYRSNEWISQPYAWPKIFMQPYVGSANELGAVRYGEKSYFYGEDEEIITEGLIEDLGAK